MTQDTTTECLLFPDIFPKPVVAQFDQRDGSSDGGAILRKAADHRYGLTERMAVCLHDERQAMNEIVGLHPDREIHVVLDNLNTHKPKEDRWLRKRPKVHFHYPPTYSSWLNQVECWFGILSRKALRGASFTSPQQVRQAIDNFVATHNQKAAPFEWKKTTVHPRAPKRYYANL